MIVFPGCKINLGLNVGDQRADGFHNLETVFYPIPLYDALEIVRAPVDSNEAIRFTCSGLQIDGNPEQNLCVKAYRLLKNDFKELPAVQMHLHKTIPMGAGLGGGSSNGAAALKLLNDQFRLGLREDQLRTYALELGSDCPFFIMNEPCFAAGRGDQLQRIDLDLSAYSITLVNPGIHVNTGWAFTQLRLRKSKNSQTFNLKTLTHLPVNEWKQQLVNDFEAVGFEQHPEIETIKTQLYRAGAMYASMSGSGSTVFGIFPKNQLPVLQLPNHYFIKTLFFDQVPVTNFQGVKDR
jgi:4-diphosphocytidyl-2-C-methyl-D-erythritol kinase